MDSLETSKRIGSEFVRQYYTVLSNRPQELYRFFGSDSSMIYGSAMTSDEKPSRSEIGSFGTEISIGVDSIRTRFERLNNDLLGCHTVVQFVDSIPAGAEGRSIFVQVIGQRTTFTTGNVPTNDGVLNAGVEKIAKFVESFLLHSSSPDKYYLLSNIYRSLAESLPPPITFPAVSKTFSDCLPVSTSNSVTSESEVALPVSQASTLQAVHDVHIEKRLDAVPKLLRECETSIIQSDRKPPSWVDALSASSEVSLIDKPSMPSSQRDIGFAESLINAEEVIKRDIGANIDSFISPGDDSLQPTPAVLIDHEATAGDSFPINQTSNPKSSNNSRYGLRSGFNNYPNQGRADFSRGNGRMGFVPRGHRGTVTQHQAHPSPQNSYQNGGGGPGHRTGPTRGSSGANSRGASYSRGGHQQSGYSGGVGSRQNKTPVPPAQYSSSK